MGFGKKLKALLKEKGLSQRKYAEEIGENTTQVNKVCNEERTPSFEMLGKTIAFFRDIDANYFFKDDYSIEDSLLKAAESRGNYSPDLLREILKMEEIITTLKKKVSQ